jgi:hypothetical protein
MAKALGVEAVRIDTADGLDILPSAFNRPAAKLIEVVVDNTV